MHQANGIPDLRKQPTAKATLIDYATRLRRVFRAVIVSALDELIMLLGDMASQTMKMIEPHVQSFFSYTLRLDVKTWRLKAK